MRGTKGSGGEILTQMAEMVEWHCIPKTLILILNINTTINHEPQ